MGESFDDITILKVNGDASRLTVEEQKEKVVDAWKNFVQFGMEKYGDEESFVNALSNNTNLDLRHSSEHKKESEDILEKLKQERDFLIKEQENKTPEYENTKGAYKKDYK